MGDMWPPLLQCYIVTCYMLHVTLRSSHCALLTSSSCHPRKISHPIFLNENAIFEQPLVWEYESAILLSFFRVTQGVNQSVDYQALISLLQKVTKSGKSGEVRKKVVCKKLWHGRHVATVVTMLQCYIVTCYMLHVTLRSSHCALPPRAGKVERAGDGLGRRARGRQEWPWQEGERDRGADW